MGTKKQNTERYMELNVPQETMTKVAGLVEESEMEANILGTGDEDETISIGFNYTPEQRDSMMEILELIEDYNSEESEEEEETEED